MSKDYLEHYGRKGMKWYQHIYGEEDSRAAYYHGSKTSSNSKSSNDPNSNSKSSTDSKSSSQTNSNKKDIAKKVALGIGVGAAIGISAYLGYKAYSKEFVDRTLKSGVELHTVTSAKNLDLGRRFYASFEKGDIPKYKGAYALRLKTKNDVVAQNEPRHGQKVQIIVTKVKNNVKIPSRQNAAKIFENLYKKDLDFKSVVDKLNEYNRNYAKTDKDNLTKAQRRLYLRASGKMTSGKLRGIGYNAFNVALADSDAISKIPKLSEIQNKFYQALKDAGYNAIVDLNDQKYSEYRTKTPLIVFDSANIVQESVKELTAKDINNAVFNEFGKNFVKQNIPVMIYMTGYGIYYGNKKIQEKKNNKSKKNLQKR